MRKAWQPSNTAARLWVLGPFVLLVFAGCAPGRFTGGGPGSLGGSDRYAQELLRAGDYGAAAQEYLRLGRAAPQDEHYIYALPAAEAYVDGRQVDAARQLLQGLAVPEKDAYHRVWKSLLVARVAMLSNEPAKALSALGSPAADEAPAPLRQQVYRYRALAHAATGHFLEAARQRILLDALIEDEKKRQENTQATWEAISNTDAAALGQAPAPPPDVLSGWMRLGMIARSQNRDPAAFRHAVEEWKRQFPDHPANQEIVPQLVQTGTVEDLHPRQIALLLPLTGELAEAATAIRDGVIAAWYNDAGNAGRPPVHVYDANPANIGAVYQRAVREGAELIIGPLEKTAISALANAKTLSVPTLALNHLEAEPVPGQRAEPPASNPPTLFQFGLLPEDEAGQIAERAWFDGHVRALALTPASPWGDRVFAAFKQRWESLGGQLLDRRSYASNSRDFATPVKSLLSTTDTPVTEARPNWVQDAAAAPVRQGADFIFLAAFPLQARQINPQIGYHDTGRLPVYSTSHVYSGSVQREADHDLDGIVFCDMPWVLDSGRPLSALQSTVQRNWPQNAAAYPRLYALGIDAYHVIPYLNRLRAQRFTRFEGETGSLRIEPDGRVHRQLVWARFSDGAPVFVQH